MLYKNIYFFRYCTWLDVQKMAKMCVSPPKWKCYLKLLLDLFLYVCKDSIKISKQTYFLRLSWNFFSGLFTPPEQWNGHSDHSVSNASGVMISLSKYFPIGTKFGTKIPQCTTLKCFFCFSDLSISMFFIEFFSFLRQPIFWGQLQTTSK